MITEKTIKEIADFLFQKLGSTPNAIFFKNGENLEVLRSKNFHEIQIATTMYLIELPCDCEMCKQNRFNLN